MSKFKVGDRVRDKRFPETTAVIVYTYQGSPPTVRVEWDGFEGLRGDWPADMFELVEAAPKFKVGDRVLCVAGNPFWGLHKGDEHVVAKLYMRSGSDFVVVEGNPTEFFASRFELVAEAEQDAPAADAKAVPSSSEMSRDVRVGDFARHKGTNEFVRVWGLTRTARVEFGNGVVDTVNIDTLEVMPVLGAN